MLAELKQIPARVVDAFGRMLDFDIQADWGILGGLALLTVFIALVFDFYNGVNDSANAIATVVATRALPPWGAVLMAGFFNFVGAFIGVAVAKAVAKGFVEIELVDTQLMLATLIGALAWTAFATNLGIPISVSHSLIGGLVGAGLAAHGRAALVPIDWDALQPMWLRMALGGLVTGIVFAIIARIVRAKPGVGFTIGAVIGSGAALVIGIATGAIAEPPKMVSTVLFLLYSPAMGFTMAYIFYTAILWIVHKFPPTGIRVVFRYLQIFSASFYAMGHGTNDAQKTMGIITALLVAEGAWSSMDAGVPYEVILMAGLAIMAGTFIGGYKVVRTMGARLTHLDTTQGFAAETSSALGLFFLAERGVPVSTTHSIAGSIMGVGAVQRVTAVSWGVARRIMAAWVITLPMAGLVAAIAHFVLGIILPALGY
ncbi:MAG TPA: anion permease [Candidatus Thermoplasmatota archaeon]|nr:anion permease [Candidatus Thermoplasmatota archaeon]